MSQKSHNQVLVIVGPTASGKSGLAIEIARRFDGEIISADSRQVYRGMDIGTGKVLRDQQHTTNNTRQNTDSEDLSSVVGRELYVSEGVVHHVIDIVNPTEPYNVTDFQRDAQVAIQDIRSRGKLPIICGGTGFWVQALVENQRFPGVEPDWKLREELSKLTREELCSQLEQLDPERAKTIDKNNPVRLIRAIEIASALTAASLSPHPAQKQGAPLDQGERGSIHNQHILALNPPFETLKEKIKKRLDERFDQGMIEEVVWLHSQEVSWKRLESFGLEYKWIAYYLQGKVTEKEMRERLYFDIVHYAKRQLTWLRRWERQGTAIHWITSPEQAFEIKWVGTTKSPTQNPANIC